MIQLNSNSKYGIPLKAPPKLVYMKNAALRGMSRDESNTRLCLVLYSFLDTPPCAVFFVYTCGGTLSIIKFCLIALVKQSALIKTLIVLN